MTVILLDISDSQSSQRFSVKLWTGENGNFQLRESGQLPPMSHRLLALHDRWISYYQKWGNTVQDSGVAFRIKPSSSQPKQPIEDRFWQQREACRCAAQELQAEINDWLAPSPDRSWLKIRDFLLTILKDIRADKESDDIGIVYLHAESRLIRKLPWQIWQLFEENQVESIRILGESTNAKSLSSRPQPPHLKDKVRILAIRSSGEDLDTQKEEQLLNRLRKRGADVTWLRAIKREDFKQLWEERWDIFYFAGHSYTQESAEVGRKGRIYLSEDEWIAPGELKETLQQAIRKGLRLAIFNSCDGLGIAEDLAKLPIAMPSVIFMQEPVPDIVASQFVCDCLEAFSSGKSLYESVWEARVKLRELSPLEQQFPGVSWMPAIAQNPNSCPPSWKELGGKLLRSEIHRQPPGKPWWHTLGSVFLVSAIVTVSVVGLRALGLLQAFELQALDGMVRLRPEEKPDHRLLVVEVTEADIADSQWPLSDAVLASLLERLRQYQPRAIGLDIIRDRPEKPGSAHLLRQLQQEQYPIVAVCKHRDRNDSGIGSPPGMPVQRLGFMDVVVDADDRIRRHLLALSPPPNSPCRAKYALSLQLALHYLESEGIQPDTSNGYLQLGSVRFQPLFHRRGGYQNADLWGHQVLLNYRTHQNSPAKFLQRVTLSEVLGDRLDPNQLFDRIILVGITDPSVKDHFNTPYRQKLRGLLVHAQMVSQILSAVLDHRPLLWVLPGWGEFLWIWVWSGVGGVLAGRDRSLRRLGVKNAMALMVLYGLCFGLFWQQGCWLPMVPSALALPMACGSLAIATYAVKWISPP